MFFKSLKISFFILFITGKAFCQYTEWPTPEVEQMYKQAKEYLSKGGIKQSIVLLQQAIQLAPDVMILHRDLAYSLNLAGEHDEAYKTIEPIIENGQADEQSYYIASTALTGAGEKKKVKKIIEKGIKKYPHSGLLYHELGKYYENDNDLEYALDAWLQGIEEDPSYHLNYYEAARMYANTDKMIWTILYGEVFVNMERQTNRSLEIRKMLLEAYRKTFNTIGTGDVPKYGNTTAAIEDENFEKAVRQIFLQLAPVVSDGITAENLTMLRTRFVMDWMENYNAKYPYSLFTYHEKMLRDGQFEAYNQWLFGRAENSNLFDGWKQFHAKALPEFENWAQQNQFHPTSGDFYNNKELSGLFSKKK